MTVYKSENWTFIPDSQELIYNDEKKHQLPSRLSTCLLTLLCSEGKTVSYDELLLKVWGTTHKDASTISSVISEVRKLIGCGQDGKKIIVTVPKRGYRYTQQINVIEDKDNVEESRQNQQKPANVNAKSLPISDDVQESKNVNTDINARKNAPTNSENVQKTASPIRKLWVVLAIVTTLTLCIFMFGLLEKINKDATIKKAKINSFTDYEVLSHEIGREDEFDVSSNNRWLTYVHKAPNVTPSLIVQDLASGQKQRLTASGDYYFGSPVFSQDAKQIVFHKQTEQQCEVWLIDFSTFNLESSERKKLTNCGKGGFWSTTAFSNDGNHVYFSRANALTDPFKVYQLDTRTLFERSITSPTSSGRGDYAFSLSPDGKRLAVVRNVLWQESHILLVNTLDNQSDLILELPYLIDKIAWLNDEQLVFCDKEELLWSYDLERKQKTQLAQIDFSCHYPVVALGDLYAIKRVRIANAIWSLNKSSGVFSIQPLITSPYYDFNAMFGPNNSLYFLSDRSGKKALWQQTDQGFKQHKNVSFPEHARDLEFSVETNALYGLSRKRLFRYDLNLSELEWLSKEQHEVFNFSISDDGKLLFSEGNKEYWRLKSLDLFTLKITDLNINAFSARQSNGKLFFTKFHEKGFWEKDLQTGVVKKVFDDINIKFNTFWDIWHNDTLIWATNNTFKIFDLKTGELLNDSLSYEGHVGFLKCNKKRGMCTFSFRENDESEIIKFNNQSQDID